MKFQAWRRCSAIFFLLVVLVYATAVFAQTKVDLRTQTKSVDFSGAASTKPAQMGTVLPSTCTQGQFFFLASAPPGQNVYGCSSTNTWVVEGAAVPQTSLVPTLLNNAGKLLTTDGNNPVWQAPSGDVTGTPSAFRVSGLLGRSLSTVQPSDGQLMKFNGTTGMWEPVAIAGDLAGTPASAQVVGLRGRQLSTASPGDGQALKFNATTGMWEPAPLSGDVSGSLVASQVVALHGFALSSATPADGQLMEFNGATRAWGALSLGGDITGNPGTATVSRIQGRSVTSTPPADGQLMEYSGAASQWQPMSLSGDVTGAPATLTVSGIRGRVVSSAAPVDGQLMKFNGTTAQWEPVTLGGDLNGAPASIKVSGLLGRPLSSATPADGQLLKYNGKTSVWEPIALGGDVAGAPATLTVGGLQGHSVSAAVPGNGQLLAWSASTGSWTPTTMQVPANFGTTFTSASSITILGTQHNLNTSNLIVSCYDNSSPANLIEPSHVTVDPASYTVTVSFSSPQSGSCALNGSGGVGMGATAQTASASLTFPAMTNGTCSSELTIAVAGVVTGNGVAEVWPALPAGFIGMMRVSATGTVAVRVCNLSGTTASVPAMTYGATVVRSF